METNKEKLIRLRDELAGMMSGNLEDTDKVGEEETYLSHVAYACAEIDASISKLKRKENA